MSRFAESTSRLFPTGCISPFSVSKKSGRRLQTFSEDGSFSRRCGLTLLDLAFYILILGVLGTLLTPVGILGSQSLSDSQEFNKIRERNRVALLRMTQELRKAMAATVNVTNLGQTVTFTLPNGYDGTNIVPGPDIQYDLQLAQGETLNGVDDNQDGLADEGQLIRTNLTTAEVVATSAGLNMGGSGFVLNGTGVTVTATTFGNLWHEGAGFQVSRTITVFPRN